MNRYNILRHGQCPKCGECKNCVKYERDLDELIVICESCEFAKAEKTQDAGLVATAPSENTPSHGR